MSLKCAECGTTRPAADVHRYSPDMDIKPVALCRVCWAVVVGLYKSPRLDAIGDTGDVAAGHPC